MRLLELTPEETAFLTAPDAGVLQARLTRRLAATLSARLRLPVQLATYFIPAPAVAPALPLWQPDAALATLWLVRRLGGQRPTGATPFVPPSLIHALDAVLAECWLDADVPLPAALAWQLTSSLGAVALSLQLPQSETEMTRWAREVVRHA